MIASEELKAKVLASGNKDLYQAFEIVGWSVNPKGVPFKNMIKALKMMPFLNTPEENERLKAALYIQKNVCK